LTRQRLIVHDQDFDAHANRSKVLEDFES
jgi:hypothetical protein